MQRMKVKPVRSFGEHRNQEAKAKVKSAKCQPPS